MHLACQSDSISHDLIVGFASAHHACLHGSLLPPVVAGVGPVGQEAGVRANRKLFHKVAVDAGKLDVGYAA